jgi:hypothetical protein
MATPAPRPIQQDKETTMAALDRIREERERKAARNAAKAAKKQPAQPAPQQPAATGPVPPAGWFPDPAGRHGSRYWDGARWTEHVTDGGVPSVDPPVRDPGA